jgi:hypothetical protein
MNPAYFFLNGQIWGEIGQIYFPGFILKRSKHGKKLANGSMTWSLSDVRDRLIATPPSRKRVPESRTPHTAHVKSARLSIINPRCRGRSSAPDEQTIRFPGESPPRGCHFPLWLAPAVGAYSSQHPRALSFFYFVAALELYATPSTHATRCFHSSGSGQSTGTSCLCSYHPAVGSSFYLLDIL